MVLLRVPFALEWCMVGVGSLNDPFNEKIHRKMVGEMGLKGYRGFIPDHRSGVSPDQTGVSRLGGYSQS